MWQDRFFVVSDNDDDTIYELSVRTDHAILEPHLTFTAPALPGVNKLDFEGIDCDPEGNFYLVSEAAHRVLRVSKDGRQTSWITGDLEEAGRRQGLFQVRNGGLEGIAYVSDNRMFVSAERQARGIIELRFREDWVQPRVWNCDERNEHSSSNRPPDFSDLHFDSGRLYALLRGDEGIAQLREEGDRLRTEEFWSFRQTLSDPAYSYRDLTFGMAEGLTMDQNRVYLIVDNNGDSRTTDPDDTRPLFYIFHRPATPGATLLPRRLPSAARSAHSPSPDLQPADRVSSEERR
jgi:uncharacterized protein YjiK